MGRGICIRLRSLVRCACCISICVGVARIHLLGPKEVLSMAKGGLVLQPSVKSVTRAEYEAHIEIVRSRRMVAAVQYAEGVNAKLGKIESKLAERRKKHYEMLEREIIRLDQVLEKVESRLAAVDEVDNEIGSIQTQFVDANEEVDDSV